VPTDGVARCALQDRDFPNLHSYKTCSWPSAVNGLASHYKLQSVAQRAVYCPSDIVIRMRPNMAMDLAPFWTQIVNGLGRTCEVYVPSDTANGAGINDNFGVMTVQAWQRYASLYMNFDKLVKDKGCFHNEVFVRRLVSDHICVTVLKSLAFSLKACHTFAEYAVKSFNADIAQIQAAQRLAAARAGPLNSPRPG